MSKCKNVLIVYAHHDCHSFNSALKDTAIAALTDVGCQVQVSDLYSMHFYPSTTKSDIRGNFKNEVFDYACEISAACRDNRLSADVVAEMEKVKWADLLIFQFPVYMLGVPAILKGWFDRVFVDGFAFAVPEHTQDHGFLAGKRAVISCTTGSPPNAYRADGICGDIDVCLWPLEAGGLHFCGLSVLQANVCYAVQFVSGEDRTKMLQAWKERVPALFGEAPKKFFQKSDFEQDGEGPLKRHSLKAAMKEGWVPAGHLKAAISQMNDS